MRTFIFSLGRVANVGFGLYGHEVCETFFEPFGIVVADDLAGAVAKVGLALDVEGDIVLPAHLAGRIKVHEVPELKTGKELLQMTGPPKKVRRKDALQRRRWRQEADAI